MTRTVPIRKNPRRAAMHPDYPPTIILLDPCPPLYHNLRVIGYHPC